MWPPEGLLVKEKRDDGEVAKEVENVRLFRAHGPRWCLELELEPRMEP